MGKAAAFLKAFDWVGRISTAQWIWSVFAPAGAFGILIGGLIHFFERQPLWLVLFNGAAAAAMAFIFLAAFAVWKNQRARARAVTSPPTPSPLVTAANAVQAPEAHPVETAALPTQAELYAFAHARSQRLEAALTKLDTLLQAFDACWVRTQAVFIKADLDFASLPFSDQGYLFGKHQAHLLAELKDISQKDAGIAWPSEPIDPFYLPVPDGNEIANVEQRTVFRERAKEYLTDKKRADMVRSQIVSALEEDKGTIYNYTQQALKNGR